MPFVSGSEKEPFLDRAGAQALDRAAIDELGIPGVVLMENAARGASEIARLMIPLESPTLILVGRGNNGGDGWAMARHLHNAGHTVEVASLGPARAGSDAATNEAISRAIGIPIRDYLDDRLMRHAALIIDALYGTGLDRPIEGIAADWIAQVNEHTGTPILAVDLPSGLDADRGVPLGPTIQATRTATFVARKRGMSHPESASYCGLIEVVGIGTPHALLERFMC